LKALSAAIAGAFVLAVDLATKNIVAASLLPGESVAVVKGFFYLTHVRNTGAAFGLLQGRTLILATLTVVVLAVGALYVAREGGTDLSLLALGAVAGGAAGNLVDRFGRGFVVDFLDFRIWPVFNVADAALVVGTLVFGLEVVRRSAGSGR